MLQGELRFVSIVGDARRQSPVQAIANTLDELAPDDVEVDVLDESWRLPPCDRNLGDAQPFDVAALCERVLEADAVVIVTPDVRDSISGVVMTALDWLGSCRSRPLAGRAVAVVVASADPLVGPCLPLRQMLASLGATLLDEAAVVVPDMDSKVDAETACLRDEETRQLIAAQLAALAGLVRELQAQSPRSG